MIVHVSSQARPGEREAGCPCAKAACGRAVLEYDERNLRTGGPCKWHGQSPVAPFKGWHCAEDCPASTELDAPLEVRGVIEGARLAEDHEVPRALRLLMLACWDAGWVYTRREGEVAGVHYAKGEIVERKKIPARQEGEPGHYEDVAVTIESVVARMSKGQARLVAVYENGRARAGWRRRNWASNWEEIGGKDLRAWAVGQ